ncbi:ATP-binding cassette domain-containing protein [Massilia sp. W12]|uniref:cell division ATP-binding protein FtsE n=1 Tax=Massilia sp. W12 TaxID=3126507 RepID=UPI0030D1F2C0
MIELQAVSKQYPGAPAALDGVSFTIQRGEMVLLAGPSGAGKSTLLKLLAALERPSRGRVLVNGQDISHLPPAGIPFLRRNLGIILQQTNLLEDRSNLDNVMLPLVVLGAAPQEARQRAQAALERLGLADKIHARPQALSGGEQQRVAIARAIVNRPQIILADEPTANLDKASAQQVMQALQSFHAAGVTCLISTHDESILQQAARVITLHAGRLAADSAPAANGENA